MCPVDSTMEQVMFKMTPKVLYSGIHVWQDLLEMQMEKSDFKFLDFSSQIKPEKCSN